MPVPHNPFKAALAARRPQIGLWLALAHPAAAEICAGAGFDWVVIDGEHGPNDIPLMLSQLQAVAAKPAHPVVRVPVGEPWQIKQVLDLGAQTVLVPMVESAEQARAMVRAMRYPPEGIRGVGAALARASDYGAVGDYVTAANDETCLLVQVESRAGLAAIDAIGAVDGVDGIFIGPSDLAADMGHPGRPDAPEVAGAIDDALARIHAAGKPSGILAFDPALARRRLEAGVTFVAVGADVTLLAKGARDLAAGFDQLG
ncbi:4-hydroxy-2-oxoheptanedioate aldolase [Rhodobacteraceae bacterium WD3A24]|nr:4-hydroxy-2-oxoheptanedioate aldolase [Rhodobacteraceae bacterium WD3A24]